MAGRSCRRNLLARPRGGSCIAFSLGTAPRPWTHKSAGRKACQSPLFPYSDQFPRRSKMTRWAKCGHPARQNIKKRGRRDPPNRMASQWASFPRQDCAPSVAARGGVILLRGGIDVPREWTSAVVPREKFQELLIGSQRSYIARLVPSWRALRTYGQQHIVVTTRKRARAWRCQSPEGVASPASMAANDKSRRN